MSDNQTTPVEHLNEMRKIETGQDEPEPHQQGDVHSPAQVDFEGIIRAYNRATALDAARHNLLREVEAWWTANHFDREFTCDHSVGICYCDEQAMIKRIRHSLNPSWTCSEAGCTRTAWHHMVDGDWCDVHLLVGGRKQQGEDGE